MISILSLSLRLHKYSERWGGGKKVWKGKQDTQMFACFQTYWWFLKRGLVSCPSPLRLAIQSSVDVTIWEQREVCLLSWKALLPVSTLLWGQRVETISVDSRYRESQDKEQKGPKSSPSGFLLLQAEKESQPTHNHLRLWWMMLLVEVK